MTFLIPSPFFNPPAPLEADVALTESGLADALERAGALLARMRADLIEARAAAAAASDRPGDAAAALAAAQRALDTARSAEAKATTEFRRAVQAGDQQRAHVARQRLATTGDTVRAAEEQVRALLAARIALEREAATAKQRAVFLDSKIAAAERALN